MGVPPAKLHEKLDALGGACFSLPAGRQAGHAWFFDPVGMGVPPAKLHEKLPFVGQAILPADSLSAGPAACKAAWFFDSVFLLTNACAFGISARQARRPVL